MTASPLAKPQPRHVETTPRTSPETPRFRRRELILYDLELSKGAKVLFLALDEYARDAGSCFPSQETLSKRLGMPLRTVQYHIQNLEKAGYVTRRRVRAGGRNEYLLSAPEECDTTRKPPAIDCGTLPQPIAAPTRNELRIERAVSIYEPRQVKQKEIPPVPPTETALVPALTQEQFTELEDGYDRHLKHHRLESRDIVLQMLMDQAQLGKFDWPKFRERHRQWCAAQERAGWRFCSLTFLAWIRAGYPPAAAQPSPIVDIQQRRREQGATLSGLFRNLDQGATR